MLLKEEEGAYLFAVNNNGTPEIERVFIIKFHIEDKAINLNFHKTISYQLPFDDFWIIDASRKKTIYNWGEDNWLEVLNKRSLKDNFIQIGDAQHTHKRTRHSMSRTVSRNHNKVIFHLLNPIKITTYNIPGFIKNEIFRHHFL